jgi:hypothetical protein
MNVGRTFGGRVLLEAAALWSLSVLPAAVYAQEQTAQLANSGADHLQEVVITGSRIARPDLDRLQPTTVVAAERRQPCSDRSYEPIRNCR